ncbi:sulfur carrier protein ThiS [Xylophilus rhododendri]|uniref:Sulfur carrier protein ThiS n=1 Tax=Xylophilus rhododendri TaxID=2697032 RepID=A0A857JC91_9BURK|nr:sulfur carrier protein ThiS [Xylophilus rhododendri]
MAIELAGRPHRVPEGSSLADLLAALGHAPQACATALNGDFVRREQRHATRLAEGDRVVLVQPIVGG